MESTLQYLRGLESQLDASPDQRDPEQFPLLVQNAFQEIDEMEFRLSCHHDGSVLVEKLLRCASSFQLRVFWDRLAGCFLRMACHRYASHVLETLMVRSAEKKEESPGAKDESETVGVLLGLPDLIERFREELLIDNMEASMNDTYGSHVIRVLIDKFGVDDKMVDAILSSDLVGLSCSSTAAPVLQALIKSSSKALERMEEYSKEHPDKFFKLGKNKYGSRTCEVLIASTPSERLFAFYQSTIRGRTMDYVKDAQANYVLQAFVQAIPSSALFLLVLDEVDPPALSDTKRWGLLFHILDWPVRHSNSYDRAISFLCSIFGLKTPTERQSILTKLRINKIGLSCLSLLPKFPAEQNRYFVDAFLALSEDELSLLAKDSSAARLLESFLSSPSISIKARCKVVRKLVPISADLACDRSGSFIIEAAFRAAPLEVKSSIADKLSEGRRRLEDSMSGRIVLAHCKIEDYERKQEEWKRETMTGSTKRSLLADIIGDDELPRKEMRVKRK